MNAPEPSRLFRYVARDADGRRSVSSLSAANVTAARAELRRRGLYPISLMPSDGSDGAPTTPSAMANGTGVALGGRPDPLTRSAETARTGADTAPANTGTRQRTAPSLRAGPATAATLPRGTVRPLRLAEQAQLLEALARFTERRITPDRALLILARGRSRQLATAAEAVRRAVRTGRALPDALLDAGALNDPAAVALLRAGDASGDLPGALDTAGRILSGRLAAGRRLVSSLIYPAILLTVSLASVGLVLVVIIPEFRPLVAERFHLIPPLGRFIFTVSEGLEALWPLFLIGIGVTGLAAASLMRRGRLTPALLRLGRRLPLLGAAVSDNRAMLTLRILGALIGRRVPVVQALGILAATPPDPDQAGATRAVTQRVERGEPLSEACEAERLLPPAAIEMMRIGEETGSLPELLLRAADDLEEAASRRMGRVLTFIEPALIVGVGFVIGISLYALFTAITAVNTIAF
ncbi:MAG: type II secretion system F family protein [Pseudomonadota bacterium]